MYGHGKASCFHILLEGGKVIQPPCMAIWLHLSKLQMHTFDPEMPLPKIYFINVVLCVQNILYTKLCIAMIFKQGTTENKLNQ